MTHYKITFDCRTCGEKLTIGYAAVPGLSEEQIREREITFEKVFCLGCRQTADYKMAAADDIAEEPLKP